MTPALPNLAGQEDVYSVHTTEHAAVAELQQVQLVVLLERFPGALARVFALLCLFELIPLATRTELCDDDAIRLELTFSRLPPDRLDLLVRKLNQLTECLGVVESDATPARLQPMPDIHQTHACRSGITTTAAA
ncbi:MAG TPA: hypothetical protein VJN01_09165 [Xanthomonadales bacterium]|nr:hypothetical protein [Xanthomonadales bacterium]